MYTHLCICTYLFIYISRLQEITTKIILTKDDLENDIEIMRTKTAKEREKEAKDRGTCDECLHKHTHPHSHTHIHTRTLTLTQRTLTLTHAYIFMYIHDLKCNPKRPRNASCVVSLWSYFFGYMVQYICYLYVYACVCVSVRVHMCMFLCICICIHVYVSMFVCLSTCKKKICVTSILQTQTNPFGYP